jgi:adenylate cyclase
MARHHDPFDIDQTFQVAEQNGLKLAIKGRVVALLLVGLWLIPTRGAERALDIAFALLVLGALGICHYLLIGSAWDRKWVKYLFVSLDLLLLSVAVAVLPPEPAVPVPQVLMFRFDVFHYYYIILGIAAFSFSPGLVLWSGVLGGISWLAAFAWVRAGVVEPLDWSDALQDVSRERFMSIILDERFVATGSRLQEAFILFVLSVLIAIVVYRARGTIRRQLEAERDKATVSHIFGQFVPEVVANSMIEDQGVLDPIEREATVLFADIAGFTSLTESRGPKGTVDVLNAYFDTATQIIGKHKGVVTQFQGDAILAVFNVPVENPAHAQCAFDAATELLDKVRECTFADTTLSIRIGINSGPLIAGNVGGGGRQSYTVHGDTVNLAARLETLNKEFDTTLLVSGSTNALLVSGNLEKVGEVGIKGLSEPVNIYTLSG